MAKHIIQIEDLGKVYTVEAKDDMNLWPRKENGQWRQPLSPIFYAGGTRVCYNATREMTSKEIEAARRRVRSYYLLEDYPW